VRWVRFDITPGIPLEYLVRDAIVQDVAEMIQLERQCPTAAHWSERQYQHLLARASADRLALVADGSTKPAVLGFLIAQCVSRDWELENIVVAPSARGKGIGARLLQELVFRVRQSEGNAIFLEVRESDLAARRLYEKSGFEGNGRRKSYYNNPLEDAVLYSKTLL